MRRRPPADPSKALHAWDALAINDADAIPPGRLCSDPGCRNKAAHVVRKRHARGGLMRSYLCSSHYRKEK